MPVADSQTWRCDYPPDFRSASRAAVTLRMVASVRALALDACTKRGSTSTGAQPSRASTEVSRASASRTSEPSAGVRSPVSK